MQDSGMMNVIDIELMEMLPNNVEISWKDGAVCEQLQKGIVCDIHLLGSLSKKEEVECLI